MFWAHHLRGTGIELTARDAQVHEIESPALERKRAAVETYRSQAPALEWEFGMLAHPEVLRYEVAWPLP